MSEVKVDLACLRENLANLVNLEPIQLWIQIEAAQLRNEVLKVRSGAIGVCRDEVRVDSDAHEEVLRMRLVPVELHERVEDFTIDKALFLECLERVAEILNHASVLPVVLLVYALNQAAAEDVVGDPEDRAQDGKAAEVFLVDLLKGENRVVSIAAVHVKLVELLLLRLRLLMQIEGAISLSSCVLRLRDLLYVGYADLV